jgi:hypothetical protein
MEVNDSAAVGTLPPISRERQGSSFQAPMIDQPTAAYGYAGGEYQAYFPEGDPEYVGGHRHHQHRQKGPSEVSRDVILLGLDPNMTDEQVSLATLRCTRSRPLLIFLLAC